MQGQIDKQLRDDKIFDIRNGCVTLAILLVLYQVKKQEKAELSRDLTVKNILTRIQRFLNPEVNPPRRLAGISTCYPSLKSLEGLPSRKRSGIDDAMVTKNRKDGSYELTSTGETLMRELVKEMRRLTEEAEQILEKQNE